jgi:hypothetical protein
VATYNYLRPIWHNGAAAVSDAPEPIRSAIEQMLAARRRGQETDELLRIEHDEAHGITIAWIQCMVSLRHGIDVASSYRTGKFLHALAMDDCDGEGLSVELARTLFETVHGPEISVGVASHEAVFEQLTHPDDADIARQLFVTGESRPKWQRPTLSPASPATSSATPAKAPTTTEPTEAKAEPTTAAPRIEESTAHVAESPDTVAPPTSVSPAADGAEVAAEPEPQCDDAPAPEHATQQDCESRAEPESAANSAEVAAEAAELEPPTCLSPTPDVESAPEEAVAMQAEVAPSLSTLLSHRSPNPVDVERLRSAPAQREAHAGETDAYPTVTEAAASPDRESTADAQSGECAKHVATAESSIARDTDDSSEAEHAESTKTTAEKDANVRESSSLEESQEPTAEPLAARAGSQPTVERATQPGPDATAARGGEVVIPTWAIGRRNESLDAMLPAAPSPRTATPAPRAPRHWPLAAGLVGLGLGLGLLATQIDWHRSSPPAVSSAPPIKAYEQKIAAFEERLAGLQAELDQRATNAGHPEVEATPPHSSADHSALAAALASASPLGASPAVSELLAVARPIAASTREHGSRVELALANSTQDQFFDSRLASNGPTRSPSSAGSESLDRPDGIVADRQKRSSQAQRLARTAPEH